MKVGDKVYVWRKKGSTPIGWGEIVQLATNTTDRKLVPLIQMEKGKKERFWGDEIHWLPSAKAIKAGARLYKDVMSGRVVCKL